MFRVILIFGDTKDLADFILTEEMQGVEVNSFELTLAATLTKAQIIIACENYGAYVRSFIDLDDKHQK